MMKIKQLILLVILNGLFIFPTFAATSTSAQSLDRIVAVVNNEVITQNELDYAIAQTKAQITAVNHSETISDAQLKNNVLQALINQKLLLEIAKRANITVNHAQVDQAIADITKQNRLTLTQLKEQLQARHISYSSYQKTIREEMIIHRVQENAISGKVQVTHQDIQDFIKQHGTQLQDQQQYELIDVLIPLSNTATHAETQAAKDKAAEIAKRWQSGENPEKFAPNDTENLGWRSENNLPTLFLNKIRMMKKGEISPPIEAPNGFHVIQLLNLRDSAPDRDQLKNIVLQMKAQKAIQDWLTEVRKTAYIKIINE